MSAAGTALRVWLVVLAGSVGLVVGSFLNVVVYRVPRGLSVSKPRSFCPRCRALVEWYDNVPLLSWALLRGRCRRCDAPISARYPVVEALTAAAFAGTALSFGQQRAVPGLCALVATSLALLLIELDGHAAPAVAHLGTVVGGAGLLGAAALSGHWQRVVGSAVAVLAASVAGRGVVALTKRTGRGIVPDGGLSALLPVAALLGWIGGAGAILGVTAGGIVLLGCRIVSGRRDRPILPGGGVAAACAAAALVAVVVGAVVGPAGSPGS